MLDIVLIMLLIVLNGVFAMSELALVSARKTKLQHWADEGNRNAATALQLASEPTRFLSTVQVGITLISILNGAFGESAIAERLRVQFNRIPDLVPYSEPLSLVCMVLIITYFSLIIGELVPKRLAMRRPERIATLVAQPMRVLAACVFPLVKLLSVSTDIILRLVGGKHVPEPSITEEEIKVLMEQGAEEGIFEPSEHELINNIFRLNDRKVASIMTPRKEIYYLNLSDNSDAIAKKLVNGPYSRFPVCIDGFDKIVGIAQTKDILKQMLDGLGLDLRRVAQTPLYVPKTMSQTALLERFKESKTQMALVIDEYGELEGLVTLNDVMEAIVGDIPTLESSNSPEAVQREDGSWLVDGMIPLDKFKKLFDFDELPDEALGEFHTLGGFVMYRLGHVPHVADYFEWAEFRFEVVDMDGNRVDKVMLIPH